MKTRLLIAAIAVAAIIVSSSMNAEEKKEKSAKKDPLAKITCPVSGKAVVADKTVAYKGAKVYFCCANCPKAFEKDTKKSATKANYQLFATKQAKATKCALKGKPLNKKMTVEVAGTKVAFCCAGCKGKVAKEHCFVRNATGCATIVWHYFVKPCRKTAEIARIASLTIAGK